MLKVMLSSAVIAALLIASIVVTHALANIIPLWLTVAFLVVVISATIGFNL